VAAEETFDCLHRGDVSKRKVEHALKKMCKEGAYWGTVAGVYVGVVYGVERVRGRSDWVRRCFQLDSFDCQKNFFFFFFFCCSRDPPAEERDGRRRLVRRAGLRRQQQPRRQDRQGRHHRRRRRNGRRVRQLPHLAEQTASAAPLFISQRLQASFLLTGRQQFCFA
ncbi:hypothetical protein ACJX0J_034963, partial [Zea mays]